MADQVTGGLSESLRLAQLEFPPIHKDKTNPHFKSEYASLDSIISGTRPALAKHGLVVHHEPADTATGVSVTAVLSHPASGQERCVTLGCDCNRANVQQIGSAITYLRRYTVAPLLGLTVDEDDDGNAAAPQQQAARPAAKPPAKPPAPKPAAPQTFAQPPGWPDTPAPELVAWINGMPSTAALAAAVGVLTAEPALTGNVREWEPVLTAIGATYKALTKNFKANRNTDLELKIKSELEALEMLKHVDQSLSEPQEATA